LWTRLPALVAQGSPQPLSAWPLPRVVDALQKLCHDVACVTAGAAPRYFPAASLQRAAQAGALVEWMRELDRIARRADHPWNAGLVTESLVQQGQRALAGPARTASPSRGVSVHSRHE
jgi:DNA polymerase-3 subunit delta'